MVTAQDFKIIREKLTNIIRELKIDAVLLSGGLDSSIIAALKGDNIKAFTIALEGQENSDLKYAKMVAEYLNIEWYYKIIKIDNAIDELPNVIKILKTFDLALPNDLAIYLIIKEIKKQKIDNLATGDGADELFVGYSYMFNLKKLDEYIKRLLPNLHFSSNQLGNTFNINIIQPYLNQELINLALEIPRKLKIKRYKGKIYGKYILRKLFEDILPKEIIWRIKTPIEYGSGFNKLRKIISDKISTDEFLQKKKEYNIKFINKEHLYYYEIFKKLGLKIQKVKEGEKECNICSSGMGVTSTHCKVCGNTQFQRENLS